MRALLIAEKPSVMRDIKAVYETMSHPDKIDFTAFVGHVVELKSPEEYRKDWGKPWRLSVLPMIPESFQYKAKKSAYDVFKSVKEQIQHGDYDYIINACDAGREGELIFQAFYEAIGCKVPVKRLWASDTTEDTLKEALLNLIDGSELSLQRLKASAKYRAYFDWLLGMNLSRALTLKAEQKIPVGRVMTPTLAIVVNRELEILNFKPKDYWQLEANFGDYKGIWFDAKTGDNKLFDRTKAEKLKNSLGNLGVVESVEKKRKTNHAPTLHSLLELQKEANKVYGYSAGETLKIAQSLYETKKLISYPRTESRFLPKNLANKLPKHLEAMLHVDELQDIVKGVLSDKKRMESVMKSNRYVDDKKVTDHHAIIVTTTKPDFSKLTTEERNIYMLVAKRMLAIFMDPYVVDKTTVITKIDQECFKSTGSTVVDLGYMKLYKKTEEDNILPELKKGDRCTVTDLKVLTKQTTPPSRYDDASLLQAMANAGGFIDDEELQMVLKETAGLGTSATRAGIIEKLIALKMIERKKKSIYATKFGIDVIKILEGKDITSPELTAKWELKLSQIEEGKQEPSAFYEDMIQYTKEMTNDFMTISSTIDTHDSEKTVLGKCPKCKTHDVIEGKSYYLCTEYKKSCDFILPKKFGNANISKTEVKKLLAGKETTELSFKWDSGKTNKGRLVLDENGRLTFANRKSESESKSSIVEGKSCPLCKKSLKETQKYIMCEGYKESCEFIIGKEVLGAKLTKKDIENLLDGKETAEKEFTWKSGKKGKAKLRLKDDGKLDFCFK